MASAIIDKCENCSNGGELKMCSACMQVMWSIYCVLFGLKHFLIISAGGLLQSTMSEESLEASQEILQTIQTSDNTRQGMWTSSYQRYQEVRDHNQGTSNINTTI